MPHVCVIASSVCRNITSCIGLGSSTRLLDAGAFVVQEYCAGGTLQQLLRAEAARIMPSYSWRACIKWMLQLARAVAYMHAHRPVMVIHRDIKSDNVLLTHRGRPHAADVKLGDFGLHKQVQLHQHVACAALPFMLLRMLINQQLCWLPHLCHQPQPAGRFFHLFVVALGTGATACSHSCTYGRACSCTWLCAGRLSGRVLMQHPKHVCKGHSASDIASAAHALQLQQGQAAKWQGKQCQRCST